MSDFISEFWGYYIAAIALVGIVWCVWLLFSQRRIQVAPGHSAGDDTGHVWDGDLRELNNPLPRPRPASRLGEFDAYAALRRRLHDLLHGQQPALIQG